MVFVEGPKRKIHAHVGTDADARATSSISWLTWVRTVKPKANKKAVEVFHPAPAEVAGVQSLQRKDTVKVLHGHTRGHLTPRVDQTPSTAKVSNLKASEMYCHVPPCLSCSIFHSSQPRSFPPSVTLQRWYVAAGEVHQLLDSSY